MELALQIVIGLGTLMLAGLVIAAVLTVAHLQATTA